MGKKNWEFCNTVKGAEASAMIYSITETAKLNNLNPYYYLEYLLERMPYIVELENDEKAAELEKVMPWSKELPEKCYKKHR